MRTRGAVRGFGKLVRAHLRDLRARRYSGETESLAKRVLPRFFAKLAREGVKDPGQIAEAHVVSFLVGFDRCASETRRAYLGALKRFFVFLAQRGVILTNPAEGISIPVGSTLPREVPSETALGTLLAQAGTWPRTAVRDRAILEVLYGTGIRRGECARLELGDVELGEGSLMVRDGKGKKDRMVPLAGRALAAVEEYLREGRPRLMKRADEGALFVSGDLGRRMRPSSIAKVVTREARTRGVTISAHGLRHACATHLLKGGASVRHVQELLGHRHLGTTSVYTHVNLEDLKDVMARAHPRERAHRRAHNPGRGCRV